MRADTTGLARIAAAGWLALAALGHAAGLPNVEPKLLPPEEAFRFSARALDARTIEARFDIADGYYLYRDKFAFETGPDVGVGAPDLPAGQRKHDAAFSTIDWPGVARESGTRTTIRPRYVSTSPKKASCLRWPAGRSGAPTPTSGPVSNANLSRYR